MAKAKAPIASPAPSVGVGEVVLFQRNNDSPEQAALVVGHADNGSPHLRVFTATGDYMAGAAKPHQWRKK